MPVESATYINDLDTANPLVGDLVSEGDNHLRLLKSALKTTFPSFTRPFYHDVATSTVGNVTVTTTMDRSCQSVDATASARTVTLPDTPTAGFEVTVAKIDSSGNAVTVTRSGTNTINGATTSALTIQYQNAKFKYIGAGLWLATGAGSANGVTAASTFATDNVLLRSDGTGRGAQASGIVLSDNDNFTVPQTTFANQKGIVYIKISSTDYLWCHSFNYGFNGTVTTTGYNTFLGIAAGNLTMGATATLADEASINTGVGYGALTVNTSGHHNVALGAYSMITNTTGYGNTAVGTSSLYYNTTGYSNAACGFKALLKNTTGYNNTAVGISAMQENTTGFACTACGQAALYSQTTGYSNTALGSFALHLLTTANGCVGIGYLAGFSITTGAENLAIGTAVLYSCSTGNNNVGVGANALGLLTTGAANVGISTYAGYDVTTGSNNVFIGYNTGRGVTTGNGNTIIGTGIGGLAATLTDTVIIAAGSTKRLEFDSSGIMKLSTAAAFAANGSVATALSSVGPTGANTTVQEWIKVVNSAGVTRYVPCF
jgi:hypothetical protein